MANSIRLIVWFLSRLLLIQLQSLLQIILETCEHTLNLLERAFEEAYLGKHLLLHCGIWLSQIHFRV